MLVLTSASALAAPCAGLDGDAALVDEVGAQLVARGVVCGRVKATLDRDGAAIVVRDDQAIPTVRRVGDATTAATVIESWTGVEDDLLASRPVVVVAERATPTAPTVQLRGWQVFAVGQTALANDGTAWLGFEGGACAMVGPICAAARLRTAAVEAGPAWVDKLERRSTELLVGGDVPFKLGRWVFAPGFGGGIGSMKTHVGGVGGVTGGLRAEVHAALSVPLAAKLALDLSAAIELTQATHEETWMHEGEAPITVPDEPLWMVRLGVGLRWGQL